MIKRLGFAAGLLSAPFLPMFTFADDESIEISAPIIASSVPSQAAGKSLRASSGSGSVKSLPTETVVTITSPAFAAPLYETVNFVSPFYDPATKEVTVVGKIDMIPAGLVKKNAFKMTINGIAVPAKLTISKKIKTIKKKKYKTASFSKSIKVQDYPRWPGRGITAELVYRPANQVLARDMSMFWDLRPAPNANPSAQDALVIEGLRTQVTDYGIGYPGVSDTLSGLEIPQLSNMPAPSLADFNSTLTANAQKIPDYVDDSTQLRDCIDLPDLAESKFRNIAEFPPLVTVLASAQAAWEGFQAAESVCAGLGAATPAGAACYLELQLLCVQHQPLISDFELCVDRIDGKSKSLTIDEVSDISLGFLASPNGSDSGLLRAHSTVSGLNGKVDGFLRNLLVRWKGSGCAPRPRVDVDNSLITAKDWLNTWATCENMEVNQGLATTVLNDKYALLSIEKPTLQSESLIVHDSSPGTFSYLSSTRNEKKGTCALDFISADAADMIETFRGPFRDRFDNTWRRQEPNSHVATSLTDLLAPFAVGKLEFADLSLAATIGTLSSKPLAGMGFAWNTNVFASAPSAISRIKDSWFYHEETPQLPSVDATTDQGANFGMSYTVTTGFLNKILHVKGAGDDLNFSYQPTWDELASFGVSIPAGQAGTDPAPLNAATLKQFDTAFSNIGNKEIEIVVRPILDPMVYMAPDLPADQLIPHVGVPLAYGISSLQIVFKEKDQLSKPKNGKRQKVVIGKTLLQLVLGFVDEDFAILPNPDTGALFLSPRMLSDVWTVSIEDNNLGVCPMTEHTLVAAPITSCESSLQDKLATLFEGRLRNTFIEYLKQIPAPLFFNSKNNASRRVQLTTQSRSQGQQNITYYGALDERL